MKEDEVKVSFSIKLTKTYSVDDIEAFTELSDFDYRDCDLKYVLREMIVNDLSTAISDGKGTFKIEV